MADPLRAEIERLAEEWERNADANPRPAPGEVTIDGAVRWMVAATLRSNVADLRAALRSTASTESKDALRLIEEWLAAVSPEPGTPVFEALLAARAARSTEPEGGDVLGTCHCNSKPHPRCHVNSWKPSPSPATDPERDEALASASALRERVGRLEALADQVEQFHRLMDGVDLRFDMHGRLHGLHLVARALLSEPQKEG